jgi:DNA polymerase III alpha subunit (gram-positive type)
MDELKIGEIKDPRGRKSKELDPQLFENLCSIFCTQAEICEIFGTTDKTLVAWVERHYGENFSEVYKKHAGKGKMSLRRAQLKMAQTNPTMAIWLGKQFLNQLDKVEEQITGNVVIKNEVPSGDTDESLDPIKVETPPVAATPEPVTEPEPTKE